MFQIDSLSTYVAIGVALVYALGVNFSADFTTHMLTGAGLVVGTYFLVGVYDKYANCNRPRDNLLDKFSGWRRGAGQGMGASQ